MQRTSVDGRKLIVQGLRKTQALLVLITAAALAPFLNKAFHIDDPLFLWMAQQIAKHPLDPYGFDVNWSSFTQPMSMVMQNPPLCSYYIAAVASVFGWSELALHSAFFFWAVLSVLGTFALARRFSREPFIAALLTIFTPVFLVSATSVMCDVMMLALWMWALEFWFAGLDRQQSWRFLLSAGLISAATLTKYFGISLVPLLAAYTLARDRRFTVQLIVLLLPLAVLFTYETLTDETYGHGLFSEAMVISSAVSSVTRPSHLAQMLTGLTFAGGCLISALFFAPFASRKFCLLAAIGYLVFTAAFYFFIAPDLHLETGKTAVWLEGGLFATTAAGILALATNDLVQKKSADALLLFLWVGGTFCFAAFFNWSITARTFLPMAPATAILMVRHLGRFQNLGALKYAPLLAAAGLSILIAIADYSEANCARVAAHLFQERYRAELGKVWFQGHWGFQYYMEQWGAKPFDRKNPQLAHGDLLVGLFSDTNIAQLSTQTVATWSESTFSAVPVVSTLRYGTGAGFYSSLHGPLPWVIDKLPSPRYYAARIR
jgi:hypothetical protein